MFPQRLSILASCLAFLTFTACGGNMLMTGGTTGGTTGGGVTTQGTTTGSPLNANWYQGYTPNSSALTAFASSVHQTAIAMNCVQCHGELPEGEANPVTGGGVTQSPGFAVNDVTNAYLNAKGFVNFQNPNASLLVQYAGNSHCGFASICGNNSAIMLASVMTWVNAENAAGTANVNGQVKRTNFVDDLDTLTLITQDIAAQPLANQPYLRYFTMESYGNYAGRPSQVLPLRVRGALIKMANNVSTGPQIVQPTTIDSQELIYRFDARQLNWTAPQAVAAWANLKAMDPYFSPANFPAGLAGAANVTFRADWFVTNVSGSAPGAYFEFLGICADNPNGGAYFANLNMASDGSNLTDVQHVDTLNGVQVFSDIAAGAPHTVRAGLTLSSTEMFNRLITWHATDTLGTGPVGSGHLFRSYNFDADVDTMNIFSHPFQPAFSGAGLPANTNVAASPYAAYEYVYADSDNYFTLPNGLYGTMTSIGKDAPGQLQSVGNNGAPYPGPTFCFQCHDGPSVQFQDAVHATIASDPAGTFPAALTTLLLGIYDQTAIVAHQTQAMTNYKAAAAQLNLGITEKPGMGTECMNIVTTNYVEVVDIWEAAAEVGVSMQQLIGTIRGNATLSNVLGGLLQVDANGNPNGSARRDTWEGEYAAVRSLLFPELPPVAP